MARTADTTNARTERRVEDIATEMHAGLSALTEKSIGSNRRSSSKIVQSPETSESSVRFAREEQKRT
jgi:hypothetical protein